RPEQGHPQRDQAREHELRRIGDVKRCGPRVWAVAPVLALALAAPALASNEHPTQSEVEAEVVCPQCHTTIDESDSHIARQMKAYIRTRIAEGATKNQIID